MLADEVELALEAIARVSLPRRDEELLHVRHGGDGGAAEIRARGVVRQLAPAETLLALRCDGRLDKRLAHAPLDRIQRQEDVADAVAAPLGQLAAESVPCEAREQLVRQGREYAGAVAGIGLVADAAAVFHGAVDVLGVVENAAAGTPLDVAHEADAAALVLEPRIVEPLGRWQPRTILMFLESRVHRSCLDNLVPAPGRVQTAHPAVAGRSGARSTTRRDQEEVPLPSANDGTDARL